MIHAHYYFVLTHEITFCAIHNINIKIQNFNFLLYLFSTGTHQHYQIKSIVHFFELNIKLKQHNF